MVRKNESAKSQERKAPRSGALWAALLALGLSLGAAPFVARAATYHGVIPAGAAEKFRPAPSSGKISPALLEVAGSLRSLRPEQRMERNRMRQTHTALPVFKVAGPEASLLQVYITLKDTSPATLDRLRRAGAQVDLVSPDAPLLQGWIPLDRLEEIAELPEVVYLSRPNYSLCNAGAVTSEGDTAMGADEIRSGALEASCISGSAFSVSGAGVPIGVLSVGLFDSQYYASGGNGDARVGSGDLPSAQSPLDTWLGAIRLFPVKEVTYFNMPRFTVPPAELTKNGNVVSVRPRGTRDLPGNRLYTPAGALMLEVVHDIAPGSNLMFGDASTDLQFHISREYLVEQGARVIVDDVAFPGLGRYDGSSALSSRVNELVNFNNIVYVTAVGDYTSGDALKTVGETSYKPKFIQTLFYANPAGSQGYYENFHSFSGSPDQPTLSRDETLEVIGDPYLGYFEAWLVWDDVWVNDIYTYEVGQGRGTRISQQGRATDDMDLLLINRETLDFSNPIAYSTSIQNGRGANPVEHIITSNTSIPMSLVIKRKNREDRRPTMMTLVITAGKVEEPDHLSHGVPLVNSDARSAISVGAVDVNANYGIDSQIEIDTIPGRNPGRGGKIGVFRHWSSDTAAKPEVLSFDNVKTATSQITRSSLSQGGTVRRTDHYLAQGSSIAAAHVAGFCALLRQRFPSVPARDFKAILSDSTNGNTIPLMTSALAGFANPPSYRLLNPASVYCNLLVSSSVSTEVAMAAGKVTYNFADGAQGWTAYPPREFNPFNHPDMWAEAGRLVVRANQIESFGYWESPTLTFLDPVTGEQRSALNPKKVYRLTMTVGTEETDPQRVPDFRLRLMTSTADEVATLEVFGRSAMAKNAPTTPEGRSYEILYRPTPETAPYGVVAALDVFPFHPEDNSTAAIYLNEVTFEELP